MRTHLKHHLPVSRPLVQWVPHVIVRRSQPAAKPVEIAKPEGNNGWKILYSGSAIGLPAVAWFLLPWPLALVAAAVGVFALSRVRAPSGIPEPMPARLSMFDNPRFGWIDSLFISLHVAIPAAAFATLPWAWAAGAALIGVGAVNRLWPPLDNWFVARMQKNSLPQLKSELQQRLDAHLAKGRSQGFLDGPQQLVTDTQEMLHFADFLAGGGEVLGIGYLLTLRREYRRQCKAFDHPSQYLDPTMVFMKSALPS